METNKQHLGRNVRKRTFGHICTEKIQISLHIRTVWSVFTGRSLDSQG